MIALVMLLLQATAGNGCAPGVYAPGSMLPIQERPVEKRKIANLAGAMFLSPFAAGKLKVKSVISGASAVVRLTDRRPRFRFCFAAVSTTSIYVGTNSGPTVPGDYRLVRLTVNGDQREVELAAVGGIGGGGASLSKSVIPVDVAADGDGGFVIMPRVDLAPGEYGFLRITNDRLASSRKKDATERVIDFAVIGSAN